MAKPRSKNSNKIRLWPLAIFAVALIVRLIVLFGLRANDPTFYAPLVDSQWHHIWATQIAGGQIFPDTVFFRAPLYPLILGLLYFISGSSILFAKLFWIVVGSLSCVIVYRIAAMLFSDTVGRIAGLTMAFYGTIVFFDTQLLFPVLIIFLNTMAVYLLVMYHRDGKDSYLYISGLLLGLSVVTRPNTIVLVPFIMLWLFFVSMNKFSMGNRIGKNAIFVLLVLLPMLPTTIHNYSVSREFIPISNQGGVNFYIGNNESADGLALNLPELPADRWISWREFIFVTDSLARFDTGKPMKPGEISSYWTSKALGWIKSDLGGSLGLTLKKAYYFFAGYENPNNTEIYSHKSHSFLLSILILDIGLKIPFGIVMPLAVFGLIATRSRWRDLMPLHIAIFAYAVTVILFFVNARYRLPVVPFVIVFAGAGVHILWQKIKQGKYGGILIPASVTVTLLILLNLNLFDLGRKNPYIDHISRAIASERSGDKNRAVSEYREALKYDPESEDAHVRLANLLVTMEKPDDAEHHFIEAIRANEESPKANVGLGKLYLRQGKLEMARVYLNYAFVRGREMPEVLSAWAEMHEATGKPDSAEIFYKRALEKSSNKAHYANLLGNLFISTGSYDAAFKYFEMAVNEAPDNMSARLNLANLKLETGDTTAAIADYLEIQKRNPDLIQLNHNLAVLYFKQGNTKLAREYAQNCLRVNPNYKPAYNLLELLNKR